MATGNYDLLVQLHEKALNKALAMVFYKGMLRVEGKYELANDLPAAVKPYSSFDYLVELSNEPFVDFRGEDTLFIRFSAKLRLTVLGGVKIDFGVSFYVQSGLTFDLASQKLFYNLQEAQIVKISIQTDYYIGKEFLNKLNFIIHEVIDKYFRNQIRTLEIPIALTGLSLPMMPPGDAGKLPVSWVDIKILNNKILAAGINFFGNGGSMVNLADYTNGRDVYIAVKDQAIYSILDFWWGKTTFAKKQDFDKKVEIGFANPIAHGVDTFTHVVTLGFVETETDYENLELSYGGEIVLDKKPVINLKTGNLVEISNLEFVADVYANLEGHVKKLVKLDTSSFIPDNVTPWKDDINLKKVDKVKTLLELKNRFTIQVNKAAGQLMINDKNNMAVKITDADFEIKFNKKGTTFSDNTWDKIMKFLKDRVLEKIPEIIISPSLILADRNIYGYTLGLADTTLQINSSEIEFSTNVLINELKSNTVAVPNYIGNRSSKAVHLFSCKAVSEIPQENRVGYYVMYEALADNYRACKQCLNAYNIR